MIGPRARRALLAGLPVGAALTGAALVGAALVAAAGERPGHVAAVLAADLAGSAQGWGYILYHATPLILTGLAVALPMRAGLFNIGGEGQLYVGAFAAALAGIHGAGLPAFVLLPLCLAAAALAGAVWGAIPGLLKASRGSHEVINTIMLNFIAVAAVNYLVVNVVKEPGIMTPQTPEVAPAARLPRLAPLLAGLGIELPASNPLNAALLVALAAAAAVGLLLARSVPGYEIRAAGAAPGAAAYGGVRGGRLTVLAMALGGGLAGLAGVDYVLGYKYLFRQNFMPGLGFMGIAVALTGRNRAGGVVLAALLFGALARGGLVIDLDTRVPRDVIQVVQAAIILLVVAVGELARRRWLPALERPPLAGAGGAGEAGGGGASPAGAAGEEA